jgi:hypothetical protein
VSRISWRFHDARAQLRIGAYLEIITRRVVTDRSDLSGGAGFAARTGDLHHPIDRSLDARCRGRGADADLLRTVNDHRGGRVGRVTQRIAGRQVYAVRRHCRAGRDESRGCRGAGRRQRAGGRDIAGRIDIGKEGTRVVARAATITEATRCCCTKASS